MINTMENLRMKVLGTAFGILATASGCGNMTEADALSLALGGYGLKGTPKQAQAAGILSRAARESGRRTHEMKTARAGKTEVTVVLDTEGRERYLGRENSMVSCQNQWFYVDKDGYFRNALVDEDNNFRYKDNEGELHYIPMSANDNMIIIE